QNNFSRRNACLKKSANRVISITLVQRWSGRILVIVEEGAVEVCACLRIPVQVIHHDGNEIQILADLREIKIPVVLLFRRKRRGQQQPGRTASSWRRNS